MITTALTELIGIRHPILLAPMGGVAGGRLAAPVSAGGGLGLVGGGYADACWLERELALTGKQRVGVGFITFALDKRPDSLRLALDHRPVAIQLSFDNPAPYADQIHAARALLVSQVQTVAQPRHAAKVGADVIIAQDQDSGEHDRPGRETIGLAPAIVDEVQPIPVVAAGGIADRRGLAAALTLGAACVCLGTCLYATREPISDPAAANLLVTATADDTVRPPVFDIVRGSGWPPGLDGHALCNRIVHQSEHDRTEHNRAALTRAYRQAADNDYSVKALWAGEGLDLIHETPSAADVPADIVTSAARLLHTVTARTTGLPPAMQGGHS